MTQAKKEATSDLDDKIENYFKAELKRAKAEMNAASDEIKRIWAEREKIYGPVEKKKSGRPTIWRGFIGYVLVDAVEDFLARCKYSPEDHGLTPQEYEEEIGVPAKYGGQRVSLAQAVRRAVRTHPILQRHNDVFDRLSDRALQARYQTAADFWSKARRRAEEQGYEAASKRWTDAIEEVNRLCDILEER